MRLVTSGCSAMRYLYAPTLRPFATPAARSAISVIPPTWPLSAGLIACLAASGMDSAGRHPPIRSKSPRASNYARDVVRLVDAAVFSSAPSRRHFSSARPPPRRGGRAIHTLVTLQDAPSAAPSAHRRAFHAARPPPRQRLINASFQHTGFACGLLQSPDLVQTPADSESACGFRPLFANRTARRRPSPPFQRQVTLDFGTVIAARVSIRAAVRVASLLHYLWNVVDAPCRRVPPPERPPIRLVVTGRPRKSLHRLPGRGSSALAAYRAPSRRRSPPSR